MRASDQRALPEGSTGLAPGWIQVQVQDAGEIRMGRQRAPKHHQGPNMRPYLRVQNVFEDRIDLSDVMEMNFEPKEVETYLLKAGDVLLNEGQSLELVGRPAIYRDELPGACFTNTLIRFRARDGVIPEFALAVFRAYLHTGRFRKVASWSTNIAHLGLGRFAEMPFPIPPKAEQERIVAKLEELFSELDAGVEALRRAKIRLGHYRQSVLSAAISGELTRKWRVSNGHAGRLTGNPIEQDVPSTWRVTSIGAELAEPLCNGISVKESPDPTEVRALRLNAMTDNGFEYGEHRHLPLRWDQVDDLCVRAGDLFVSRGNGSLHLVGRCVMAQAPPFNIVFPDTMIRIRLTQDLGTWVNAIWSSRFVRSQIEARVKTTAGIWKISQPQLRSIEIPLPPPEEREVILEMMSARLSEADRLMGVIQFSLRKAERLRQSILERAFRGELVPQDPADEPAEAVMARLRESSATKAGQGMSTKRSYVRKTKMAAGGA